MSDSAFSKPWKKPVKTDPSPPRGSVGPTRSSTEKLTNIKSINAPGAPVRPAADQRPEVRQDETICPAIGGTISYAKPLSQQMLRSFAVVAVEICRITSLGSRAIFNHLDQPSKTSKLRRGLTLED